MVFWPYLELVLFNQAYQGVLPSMIPLEQSSAHWKETTKKLQLVIYNPEYSIRPNVHAKLDPKMTSYDLHLLWTFKWKTWPRNKRKNNFISVKMLLGRVMGCAVFPIPLTGSDWSFIGFHGFLWGFYWTKLGIDCLVNVFGFFANIIIQHHCIPMPDEIFWKVCVSYVQLSFSWF